MKRWQSVLVLGALALLLSGCASTIKSEVTAFHEWPSYVQDKSYIFERTREQENNLEYRSYENLVRAELRRLGFTEAPDSQSARLKASMGYSINSRDVRVSYPVAVDPWYGSPWRGYYGPGFYGPGYYSPFYDPFWYGPPIVERREENYQVFNRQFRFTLSQASDAKKLYDMTVVSEGRNGSLPAVLPYMVHAAFVDFPGKSGVPRQVELKMK